MIYLSDIRDWLKSVTSAEHYYIGKLDNKQDRSRETEEFARRLYETLYGIKNVEIKEHKIYIIELLTEEPVDVGTDDKGVYEQVIEVKFYYERK